MQIEDIINEADLNKRVKYLQSQRKVTNEMIEEAKKALDPNLHAVTDQFLRKKREVTIIKKDDEGNDKSGTELKEVNRIPFSYQADIVDKRVSFMFGNPLQVTTASENSNAKPILKAINQVNKDVKIDSINRQVARTKMSYYEVAEYWFVTDAENHNKYGFDTDSKIKVISFRPDEGDVLYPFYDRMGDMKAFSRGFTITDVEGKKTEYLETWTNDGYARLVKTKDWEIDTSKDVAAMDAYVKQLGKIPITYGWQPKTEYYKVQRICDRQDTLASNHGDINDRHALPILVAKNATVSNKIEDFVQIEGDKGELDYIAWNNATDSLEAEFSRNEDKIYSLTRTPKTSFEEMKGIGNAASGEGQKIMFMDAHLEVMNKMEDFDIYFTRRYNIIKAIFAILNPSWKNDLNDVEIDIKVIPYMMGEDKERVQMLIDLYSSNMISLETACKLNPFFEDALSEYKKILKEKEDAMNDPKGLDQGMNEDEEEDSKEQNKK